MPATVFGRGPVILELAYRLPVTDSRHKYYTYRMILCPSESLSSVSFMVVS